MGRRGPKPTPTAILKKRGSWLANTRPDEPEPTVGLPVMPDWLDDTARRYWSDLAEQLVDLGVLTVIDGNALALYCQTMSDYEQADAMVKAEGLTFTDDNGGIRPHPAVAMKNHSLAALSRLGAALGLTPADRTRVKAVKPAGEGMSIEEFAKGRAG